LGKKMFGFAEEWCSIYGLGEKMQATIKDVFEGKKITEALLDECKLRMKAEIDGSSCSTNLRTEKPRTVELEYRGEKLTAIASGTWEEFTIRLDVFLKTTCQPCKKPGEKTPYLLPLFCEEELKPTLSVVEREVEEAVYKRYNSCRSSASHMLSASRQQVSEHVLTYLEDSAEVLCLLDASITVEAAWFKYMAEAGCQKILRTRIQDALPMRIVNIYVKDQPSQVDKLTTTALYMFASRNSQSDMNVVCEWARALASNRQPTFAAVLDDPSLKEVQQRMSCMLRVTTSGESSDIAPNILCSSVAMTHLFKQTTKKVADGEAVPLQDLQIFNTYAWLMSKDDAVKHESWAKAAFQAAGSEVTVATKGGLAAASSSGPATSGKRPQRSLRARR
jgi:hypothetical protein